MLSSLDKLVRNFTAFPEASKYGKIRDGTQRKHVYPYEYIDSFDKFNSPLPPKKAFYSTLDQTPITDKDYEYAVTTLNQFNLKTLRDLHKHYVEKDVLLVCDVFEEFRNVCTDNISTNAHL